MNTLAKYEKYFYLILLIGFVVYFPIFFNGFVWDDFLYIVNNTQIHQLNIPVLFGPGLFNSASFYRPLSSVYFALVYAISGQHALLYHVIQLGLHILSTILLFIFFIGFFDVSVAFFLSLVFLVHPINVESVAYIGASQSELYFLPGILALILARSKIITNRRLIWIIVLLLLAIFTKETGFLFLFLVIVYRYVFVDKKIKIFLIAGISIIVFYLLARLMVANVGLGMGTFIAIAGLTFSQRLLNIPLIILYYVKIFFFPLILGIWQQWVITSPTIVYFLLPFVVCLLVIGLLVALILYCKKLPIVLTNIVKGKKQQVILRKDHQHFLQLLFFTFWLIIGMGIIIQLVPLDMTVADRWFYFPIVGLLGILGVCIQLVKKSFKIQSRLFLYGAILIICLLSVRTFIRTFDYKDNLTLFSHDLKSEPDNLMLRDTYILTLMNDGENNEAFTNAKIGSTSTDNSYATRITDLNYLALLYEQKNEYPQAIQTFKRAIALLPYTTERDLSTSFTRLLYVNLASLYLNTSDYPAAVALIKNQGLIKFPKDSCLSAELETAQYDLGNSTQPQKETEMRNVQSNKQVNTGSMPSPEQLVKLCGFTQ